MKKGLCAFRVTLSSPTSHFGHPFVTLSKKIQTFSEDLTNAVRKLLEESGNLARSRKI